MLVVRSCCHLAGGVANLEVEIPDMAKSKSLITTEQVTGAWAIMPTPAKPNASDWREQDTVDLDETARVVDGLIAAGVDGILALGTLGECATLTWDEQYAFMAALVDSAAGRIPVFVGTTSLNTRETVRQTRIASDLGTGLSQAGGGAPAGPSWSALAVALCRLRAVEIRFYGGR